MKIHHMSKIHPDLKCDNCDFTAKSNTAFRLHIDEIHGEICKINENLKRSHSESDDQNIIKWPTCNTFFNRKPALNKHMRNHKVDLPLQSPPMKKFKEKTEVITKPIDLTASQKLLLPEAGFLDDINDDLQSNMEKIYHRLSNRRERSYL